MGTPSNTTLKVRHSPKITIFLPTSFAATQMRDKRQSIHSYHGLTSLSLAYIQILNEILRWAHPQIPPKDAQLTENFDFLPTNLAET